MECRDLRLQQTNLLCEETRQRNGNVEDNIPIANGLPLEGEWTVYPSGEMKNSNGGDAGREVEPVDSPNESEALVTLSIESEDPESGGIPRVYLGGMRMWTGDANGLESQANASYSRMDESASQVDVSRRPETNIMDHGDSAGMYLSAGGAKRPVYKTDGAGTHAGTLTRQTDASSIETKTNTPANAPDTVRIP